MRKRTHIRTTFTQRKSLYDLSIFLAEQGYKIFPVNKRHKRHRLDFLAVPTGKPQQLLLVRPARNGIIEFRTYVHRNLYHHIRTELRVRKKMFGRMHWTKQLPTKHKTGGWGSFVPKQYETEFKLFT